MYADVIVDISHENLDKTYQYHIPTELEKTIVPGVQVVIPFGAREIEGFVIEISDKPKIDVNRIKDIICVKSDSVVMEKRMIMLADRMRRMFGGTMNDALRTVLPVKKTIRSVTDTIITLSADTEKVETYLCECVRKHYVAKERLIKELLEVNELEKRTIVQKLSITAATISSLERDGIVSVCTTERMRNVVKKNTDESFRPVLNDEQMAAYDEIVNDYKKGIRKTYLIHGVTGSGKTEVYMNVIEDVIKMGKQVIVLIPEIALTYQTVKRFSNRFADRVAFLHSKLSDGERYDQYRMARNGQIDIMIGPRSALFTPFENLGLIIIDEEHENSYKSENVPKYHAREIAVELAQMTCSSVILGSATPSLESYHRAITGEYKLLKLTKRAKGAVMPKVLVADLREELHNNNRSMFSVALANKISDRLQKKEQIILFLNRRGYAGSISCRDCGEVIMCPHCSVALTLHYNDKMCCHYCGYETKKPSVCPHCGSKHIASFGTGTQKIEENVKKIFPGARVLRMDADTTKEKDSYEKILSSFANHDADILVGTQMIVKGHDFPYVTLVGIMAADLSLNVPDYRACEKTFDLLAQAAGRSGRDKIPGEVVIQTYRPDHYSIVHAVNEDYEKFYEDEAAYRKICGYPPFAHIVVAVFSSKDEEAGKKECAEMTNFAKEFLKKENCSEVTIIGPAPAYISKTNDIYRNLVYFKATKYDILSRLIEQIDEKHKQSALNRLVSVVFDMDPACSY